jgi:arylsulfatase A-like enzyme
MDDTSFDSLTRRHVGLAAGGILASLLGLSTQDEAEADKKKRRRRRRRRAKRRRRRNRNRSNQRPNIVLINVDDMRQSDYRALTRTRALLQQQGASYPNYFLTTPLCGPSRASLFRGQFAHNHGVLKNNGANGGWNAYHNAGVDQDTMATWLQAAQYRTAHIGKHINGYRSSNGAVGPGWSEWIVPVPVNFFDYDLNVNGTLEPHGNAARDYLTDVMATKAEAFIASTPATTPLFLYFAPKAPHGPATPAPRHEGAFAGHQLAETGSFNEADMSDKPAYMQRPLLTDEQIRDLERRERDRLESLLSVDEAIERIVNALQSANRLQNTYIFFTTDNGYLLGQHRHSGKAVPYEEAIGMSMLVRGPGVSAGSTNDAMVANIDLAPTFAELAGATTPGFVDGRSLVSTLRGGDTGRSAMLIEIFSGQEDDPEEADDVLAAAAVAAPSRRRAIRTADWLYGEYGSPASEFELYNLHADPEQLESQHGNPDLAATMAGLSDWLHTLVNCTGNACRSAEDVPPA